MQIFTFINIKPLLWERERERKREIEIDNAKASWESTSESYDDPLDMFYLKKSNSMWRQIQQSWMF